MPHACVRHQGAMAERAVVGGLGGGIGSPRLRWLLVGRDARAFVMAVARRLHHWWVMARLPTNSASHASARCRVFLLSAVVVGGCLSVPPNGGCGASSVAVRGHLVVDIARLCATSRPFGLVDSGSGGWDWWPRLQSSSLSCIVMAVGGSWPDRPMNSMLCASAQCWGRPWSTVVGEALGVPRSRWWWRCAITAVDASWPSCFTQSALCASV